MVECLTQDRRAVGFEPHIYPSLVLVQPRKIRPYITERLLMGRKESNQTNKQTSFVWLFCTSERSCENSRMYDFVEKSMQSELWQVYKTIRSYQNMPKRPTLKPGRKRPSRNYPRPETYV